MTKIGQYIITIIMILYFIYGITGYFFFSLISIYICSFMIGLYIFSLKVSDIKNTDFIRPNRFNFLKFIVVIFFSSTTTHFFYPSLLNDIFEIFLFIKDFNISLPNIIKYESSLILVILTFINGIFFYFFIQFIIHGFFIIIIEVFIYSNNNYFLDFLYNIN